MSNLKSIGYSDWFYSRADNKKLPPTQVRAQFGYRE